MTMSLKLRSEESLERKWHLVDERCRMMGEGCPQRAQEKIGEAATRLFQAREWPQDRQHFLGLAQQCLSQAEWAMQKVGK